MRVPIRRPVSRRLLTGLTALAAIGFVIFGSVAVAYAEHSQYVARVRAQVISDASEVRAELESALANRLVLADALAALAAAHAGDVSPEFDGFAKGLASSHRSYLGRSGSDPALRSLQLAPDAVVTYVYPLEGNEEAMGHDLLADPLRGAAVQRAIDERRFVLAGPISLLQGGLGLVGRNPIYLEDEFWGFASVVINFDVIASEVGLNGSGDTLFAVRGQDGTGSDGEIFFGQPHVFDHDPVTLDVLVPNGTWEVAAHPVKGWPRFPTRAPSVLIMAGGLLMAAGISMSIWRSASSREALEVVSDDRKRLIDSTTSPVFAVDARGSITEWNPATEDLSGIDRALALGRPPVEVLEKILGPGDLMSLGEALAQVAAEAAPRTAYVTTSNGVALSFTMAPRPTRGGATGVVCIGQDVTARIEAEAMRAENIALERSSRLKDEFLAGMSHELRTPLNAVIGLSKVLGRETFGTLTEKQGAYVEQIGRSGEHLLALINDILDLARLDAAQTELEVGSVGIEDVVRESLDLIGPMAHRRGLAVDAPEASVGAPVVIDRRRVRQVLVNLLGNAVKFTEPGGAVGVEIDSAGHEVRVTVWDTGIGIPLDKQHLLFEPFLQLDGSLARASEGSGLGLAIAAKLVKLHGGEISVESSPGAGSRFTVTLPREPAVMAAAAGS
ncbi:MAG: ATP-binding protein [Acidimicrobiia bacterium]|nr:ATP-binding protein [Acidimicrobiia bacterium]